MPVSPPGLPPTGMQPGDPGTDFKTNTFDGRIRSIPSYVPGKNAGPGYNLWYGSIFSAFPKNGPNGTLYTLNFMYNPSTVQVSHSLDASNALMPSYTRSDYDTGTPLVGSGGALSFSLLFDRTYETSDSSYGGSIQGELGVGADIQVLYNLVGVNTPQVTWWNAGEEEKKYENGASSVLGTMQMNPVWVRFSQTNASFSKAVPYMTRLVYFGYISAIGISYTHFTQRMVPVRCAVSLSMQLMSTNGWT